MYAEDCFPAIFISDILDAVGHSHSILSYTQSGECTLPQRSRK